MGTRYFHSVGGQSSFKPSSLNLEARAGAAGSYASKSAGSAASKNLSAASAMTKYMKLKPSIRGSAYAPGPKKV